MCPHPCWIWSIHRGTFYLKLCSLGLERDGLRAQAKRRERGGENVYLDPYSHIDQSLVEVRLARDNNDPDLGTRHVSVLLSSRVIDPVGLLSAAWIHSRASLPRHTAVTRHKEGSISTATRCLLPHLHAPSKSLHQPPGRVREKRPKNTETTDKEKETEREKGRKNRRQKGGEKVKVDSVTTETREQHQGFTSNQDTMAAAQPHVNTAASAAEHT